MRIEKYEQKSTIRSTQAGVPVDPNIAASKFQAINDVGRTLSSIGDQMTEAQALQEKTQASINAKSKASDIVFRAKSDPDYRNAQKYADELLKVQEESGKNIKLRSARNAFSTEFATLYNASLMQIKQDARTKMIGQLAADFETEKAQIREAYKNSDNPVLSNQMVNGFKARIDSYVARGVITPKEGAKEKESILKDWNKAKAENEVYTNPEAFLENESSGAYADVIDPKDLESMRKSARTMIEKEEKRAKEEADATFNANEASVASSIINDDPNVYIMAERALNDPTNPISEKFFNILKDSMEQDLSPNGKSNQTKVESLLEKYSKVKNTEDMLEFRYQILIDKPDLDEEKFKTFLSWTTPQIEQIVIDKRGWLQKGIDWIKSHYTKAQQADALFKYVKSATINDVKDGQVVQKAGRSYKVIINPDGSKGYELIK